MAVPTPRKEAVARAYADRVAAMANASPAMRSAGKAPKLSALQTPRTKVRY